MRNNRLLGFSFFSMLIGTAISFSSCSDNDNNEPDPTPPADERQFNIVLAVGDDGNDGVYIQSLTDVASNSATVTFENYGLEIPSTRTARVCASDNGEYIYSLDYGGGTITSFQTKGGQTYEQKEKIDITAPIGTNPRWGKVADNMILLHTASIANKYKDGAGTQYDYTEGTAKLVAVNLDGKGDMSLGSIQTLTIPRSEEDIEKNLAIWRIDAPVVHNGKVYYGVAKRGYDPNTGDRLDDIEYSTTTLVADYPSLNNLKTISSTVCTGENYGYRTPNSHLDEKGDIYQLVGNGREALMLKISNENYDNSYKFDLSEALALGYEVGALGWFYTGNGIGYVPFYDNSEGKGQGEAVSAWGIARVDVYNKTAVKMNIPYKLWLRQYQKGVLHDGKFYMALAPVGAEGRVYIFDPSSTSADGFTTGAKLDNKGGEFYIGIF